MIIDERMDHDLCFPFMLVKRGWRAVDVPQARASEKMVPSIGGEFARKRRMNGHIWTIVLRSGMLVPRGYGLRYGWMILSHRLLRYAAPALHVVALATNVALVGHGTIYVITLAAQLGLLLAALAGGVHSLATAVAGTLLRADECGARSRPVGPPAPRDAARLGSPRGDAVIRRAVDVVVATTVLVLASPLLAVAIARDPARVARRRDLSTAAGRPAGARVRRAQAAHDGGGGRAARRRAAGRGGRRADHPRRRVPATDLARRAAEPLERACVARCR